MGYTEKIESHDNYPNVLGETDFGSIKAVCPPLALREVGTNTVAFAPLQVTMFDVTLTALGVHTGLEQEVEVVAKGARESDWAEHRKPAEVTMVKSFGWTEYIPPGKYTAKVHVDAETARRILELEREHKEDAEYAYKQTIEHLAGCVESLAGRTFTGDDDTAARRAALEALAAAVGPRFVPAYPMIPANWSALARHHCRELLEESKKRDTEGAHRVSWTVRAAEAGVLHLVPVIPDRGLTPSELLDLANLRVADPDWAAAAPPVCPFSVGDEVEVTTELDFTDSAIVPVGWRGTYDADLSDASGSRFAFMVHDPDAVDTQRQIMVSPSQFGWLRAVARPAVAPVAYADNPFAVNDIVRTTGTISTTSGEIPLGAIGQFDADNSDSTGVQLLFYFPGVRATNGYPMSAKIAPDYLRYLERCDETLPDAVPLLPKEDDDETAGSDNAGTGDEDSDGDEDPDIPSVLGMAGVVTRLAGSVGSLTGETQDSLAAAIAESLRAARDAAREKTT